jgi:hypothetical protein
LLNLVVSIAVQRVPYSNTEASGETRP